MNEPILPLLVALLAALLLLGGVGSLLPRNGRQVIGFAACGISGLAALLTLGSLLLPGPPARLVLPIGPPGIALPFGLDPLAAFFLLLLLLVATLATAFAAEAATDGPGSCGGMAAAVAGLGLALLAADPVGISAGIGVAAVALWASGPGARPKTPQLIVMLAAAGALLLAAALIPDSARLRDPATAIAYLALTLIGGGALVGLVPLHAWLIPAHRAAPARVAALLSGGVMPLGVYVELRLVAALPGAAPPLWWGVIPLLCGGMTLLFGGWVAAKAAELDAALAAGSQRMGGMIATGIGLLLVGRAADLPSLAALAASAIMLLSAVQALGGSLLMLIAGVVQHGAGTRRLDRLGGLAQAMPVTALAAAAGLFALSALPLAGGFAGLWLLFQALLAAPRIGGLAEQLILAGLGAVLGLSSAYGAITMVRLYAVVFLGRPRTPRGAAAKEIGAAVRPPLLVLAALSLLLGLLPGPLVTGLAVNAVRQVADADLGAYGGWLGLAAQSGMPGYAVLPLAALLGLIAGATFWLLSRRLPPARPVPTWHAGFAAPPAWLPFGDPLTQADGSGFVPPLPSWPRRPRFASMRGSVVRLPAQAIGVWAVLAALALLLVLLTWLRPA